MNGIHDLGGMHGFERVPYAATEPNFREPWEGRVFALLQTVAEHLRYPVGGFRHAVERLPPAAYLGAGYYARWLAAIEAGLLGAGVLGPAELAARAAAYAAAPAAPLPRREDPAAAAAVVAELAAPQAVDAAAGAAPRFAPGATVRARNVHPAGHTRLPRYVRGRLGTVVRVHGVHAVQDTGTAGVPTRPAAQPVYHVRFPAAELWGPDGGGRDAVGVDLWEGYLEPAEAPPAAEPAGAEPAGAEPAGAPAPPIPPAPAPAARARALEALLVEKGLVASDALDAVVRYYEREVGPGNGARVVARAWVDPAYKRRLLAHGTPAIAALGFAGEQGAEMLVVENTPAVHNLVVCTLCSCYPWPVLGLPPAWYKSLAYRARTVREPRAVLGELGLVLDDSVAVRVWDSTAELRYLVLPERPAGTAGLGEADLAALVTRDAMIGVARVARPA